MSQDNFTLLAGEWLEKASHDFDEAQLSLNAGGWTDIICFHCQQAAEKCLKAFLVSKGINIVKIRKLQIHDLTKLWNECYGLDSSFDDIEEESIQLNPYYIEARYPLGAPKVYTKEQAAQALESAEKIMKFITDKI